MSQKKGIDIKLLQVVLGSFLLLCFGCQTVEQNAESLSARFPGSNQAGVRAGARLKNRYGGICNDPAIEARLNRIGRQIVKVIPDMPVDCTFELLNSHKVNALSLSNGNIFITRGLYNQMTTDDLLAAAFAHELGHVTNRNSLKLRLGIEGRLAKEMAADHRAILYLKAAGFDQEALIDLMEITRNQQPPTWADQRIAAMKQSLN